MRLSSSLPQTPLMIGLALAVLLLAFLIIKPLLTAILSGVILAYLFYPTYEFLCVRWCRRNRERGRIFAAWAVVILIILAFLAPLLLLSMLLFLNFHQMTEFFARFVPAMSNFVSTIAAQISFQFLEDIGLKLNMTNLFLMVSTELLKIMQTIFAQLPSFLLGFLVSLFIIYHLLKHAEDVVNFLESWLPLHSEIKEKIIRRFNHLGRGMIASQLVIALIQGVLIGIACLILGIKHVLLLALLTMVLAIIPFMGAVLVWVILTLYLADAFLQGQVPLWHPIFMFLYGSIFVSTIDNIVRPKILSDAAKINPAIVLVGFIGGFMLFGLPGVFLGPMILTLTELALEVFLKKE